MKSIIYWVKAFQFSLIFNIIVFVYRELPLRFRLFKKRIIGFLLVMLGFALLIYHMEYVFYEFAFSAKAGKYSIYQQVFQCHSKWYKHSVAKGLLTLKGIALFYVLYFLLSSIFISIYAHAGKWKEQGATIFWICFLLSNNWFAYAYSFYLCQANVMVLACFIYNFFYWLFHLILWDEEMETYYENQVDLAQKGRENFEHSGSNSSVEEVLTEGDKKAEERKKENPELLANLRKLSEEGIKGQAFNYWLFHKSSRYINLETLQLQGDFADSNVVETVSDLEDRYKKHLQTFYLNEIEQKEQKENAEIKTELETPLMDDLVEFGMINYFLVYQIRWWEDLRAWRNMQFFNKIRVKILSILHILYHKRLFVPKVVGPYNLYSPSFKAKVKFQEAWFKYKFLYIIKWLLNKLWMFFSVIQRYQNWRWFLFMNRFSNQRKYLIKKRKTINYSFFKKQK